MNHEESYPLAPPGLEGEENRQISLIAGRYSRQEIRDEYASIRRAGKVLLEYRRQLLLLTGAGFSSVLLLILVRPSTFVASVSLKVGEFAPVLGGGSVPDPAIQESRDADFVTTLITQAKGTTIVKETLSDPIVQEVLQREPAVLGSTLGGKVRGGLRMLLRIFRPKDTPPPPSSKFDPAPYQIQEFGNRVTIDPVKKTNMFSIAVMAYQPEDAALFANAYARTLVASLAKERRQRNADKLRFLQERSRENHQKLESLERRLSHYVGDRSVAVSLGGEQSTLVRQYENLQRQLDEAMGRRVQAQEVLELHSEAPGGSDSSFRLQQVGEEIERLMSEYSGLRERFLPAYPRMRELHRRIEQLRRFRENLLKKRFLVEKGTEARLHAELERLQNRVFSASKAQLEYNLLEGEYQTLRELNTQLLKQIEETSLAVHSDESPLVVTDLAEPPLTHSSPRRFFIGLVGLVVAPICAGSLILLYDRIRETIRDGGILNSVTDEPVLGEVSQVPLSVAGPRSVVKRNRLLGIEPLPPIHGVQTSLLWSALATHQNPLGPFAEEVRTICLTAIGQNSLEERRSMLVTSARRGAGKTTISANIAVALAQMGKRVVILDTCFRIPDLSRCFTVSGIREGIQDYLVGRIPLQRLVLPTAVENLHLVSPGRLTLDSSSVFSSKRFAFMLAWLEHNFDHVIIDAPAILEQSYSLHISTMVGGVLHVVRAGVTNPRDVSLVSSRLSHIRAHRLGIILNGTSHFRWPSDGVSEVVVGI